MSLINSYGISQGRTERDPSKPTLRDWLSTSTAKRKLHKRTIMDCDESETVIREFHEPQIKWRRAELDDGTQTESSNQDESIHHSQLHATAAQSVRMSNEDHPPDTTALVGTLAGSSSLLMMPSPVPLTPASPATWNDILGSPQQNDLILPMRVKSLPEQMKVVGSKQGKKELDGVRSVGWQMTSAKSSLTSTTEFISPQPPNPETSTPSEKLYRSSQQNNAMLPAKRKTLPKPVRILSGKLGNKEQEGNHSAEEKKKRTESSSSTTTEKSGKAPSSHPGTSTTSQQNVLKAVDPPHQTAQTVQLPRPAATEEELLDTFQNLDKETVRVIAQQCKAKLLGRTVTNIMKLMMEKQLAQRFSWTGVSSKKGCSKLAFEDSPAHKFLKKILKKTPFAKKNKSKVRMAVTQTLHNVSDWGDGRISRRKKDSPDPDEATTSENEMRNVSVQTSNDHFSHVICKNSFNDSEKMKPQDEASTSENDMRKTSVQNYDDYLTHDEFDTLVKDWKFRQAILLLEAHPITQLQQMKLLESYFQVREDAKIVEVIENMKMLMTQAPHRKAADVCKLGCTNSENSSHVKAMTLFACAAKMYLLESDVNDSVHGIQTCASHCSETILQIIGQNERMRDLASNVGMKIMNGFIDDLVSVENADPDLKAVMEARCLYLTGYCYEELSNRHLSKEYFRRSIDIIPKQLSSNPTDILQLLFGNANRILRVLRIERSLIAETTYEEMS